MKEVLFMYDLARVQKEFMEVCKKANAPCNIPIKLNGRLTRTLGRVHQQHDGDEYWYSTLVEFSKQLLETATDESIDAVIKHEAAHYIATYRTHENHGHDALFKAICAEIGTTNDKTKTKVERTIEASAVYKYQVYCPTCETMIGGYSRMGKTLKNLDQCYCKKCKQHGLQLIQNW